MSQFVSKCPHCHTENVAFASHGAEMAIHRGQLSYWNTFFVCRKCRKGIVVELKPDYANAPNPHEIDGDPQDNWYSVDNIYPAPQKIEAPYAVPDGIADNYREGENNFARENFASAGMMFRRVLDRATKRLAPSQKGKRLYERIEWLANQHKITEELKELAHFIRDDGNDASHEDKEFTEDSARQMKDFTYLFLMYTFTLPQLVEDARIKDKPSN